MYWDWLWFWKRHIFITWTSVGVYRYSWTWSECLYQGQGVYFDSWRCSHQIIILFTFLFLLFDNFNIDLQPRLLHLFYCLYFCVWFINLLFCLVHIESVVFNCVFGWRLHTFTFLLMKIPIFQKILFILLSSTFPTFSTILNSTFGPIYINIRMHLSGYGQITTPKPNFPRWLWS